MINTEKVEKINPFKMASPDSKNPNVLRDIVIGAVELSKRTKVPILFTSNPGFGKTTTIYKIAEKAGYHAESLCASQYAQDELLGFQTNEPGQPGLIIKEPEWYTRIMYNHNVLNKPSILFLDELSTVSGPSQGALLQICFERRIRGGKELPDDCLIVAAANYKANLPGYSEIIAPTLNRFCIINLLPENATDVIEEFTQDLRETDANWPEFENYEVDRKMEQRVVSEVGQTFTQLFKTYTKGSNKGFLDIRNIYYDGIFDRDDGIPELLNFISGRTISYLSRVIIGLISMGVPSSSRLYKKAIEGLIGLGTNTWVDADDGDPKAITARLEKYIPDVQGRFGGILDKNIRKFESARKVEDPKMSRLRELMGDNTISNKITAFTANEDTDKFMGEEFTSLFKDICQSYGVDTFDKNLERIFKDDNNMLLFRSDMDCLETLTSEVSDANALMGNIKPYSIELTKIWKSYKFYYDAAGLTLNNK